MTKLVAEKFMSDPRVVEAKETLLKTLREYQDTITGIRPPVPDLKQSYDEAVEEFSRLRGGNLYFPYLGGGMGRGPFVELADGSVKYDFITGIGVHYYGHGSPEVVEAVLDAALSNTIMQGNLQQNMESLDLARLLIGAANARGADIEHCFITTSGAMANENALKIIFQRKAPADRLLAFSGCFAGRTLTLSQVTDKPEYRIGLPPTVSVDYVPFYDANAPRESLKNAVIHLKKHMRRYPGRHAAMVFELIQGEGGFNSGDTDFFATLMQLLSKHGIAVMLDEIQTFGRTDEIFAFQRFGLDRFVDVVTIGKMSQVCATLFRGEFKPGVGLLSQTFTAPTAAIKAAQVIISDLLNGDYFGQKGKIARVHERFENGLAALAERRPGLVEGPYGVGSMIVFTPLGGDRERVVRFVHELFDAGVISFICGSNPLRVRFHVPIGAVTYEHIDEVLTIIEQTLVKLSDKG